MLNRTDIEEKLADAVVTATGLDADKVIIANQDAPRPSGSYATVFVTPARKLGTDRVELDELPLKDFDEKISGHREVLTSINFYRNEAFDNASKFETQLQSNGLIEFFKANGLGFKSVSDIRDLSEVIKKKWEQRAQIDLTIYAITNFSGTVMSIEEVNVDGIAESGNEQTNININIKE